MKMFDINGKAVNVNVTQSAYPMKRNNRSDLQSKTGQFLRDTFPRSIILEDFTIPGSRLSVDFFLPKEEMVVEVQGRQHDGHVGFFHGDRRVDTSYGKQQMRDRKKAEWASINCFDLFEVRKEQDWEYILDAE